MATNPLRNHAPAVRYRVGSLGALHAIPAEGLDSETWYALMTTMGVEWYDEHGAWTDSPPAPEEETR